MQWADNQNGKKATCIVEINSKNEKKDQSFLRRLIEFTLSWACLSGKVIWVN